MKRLSILATVALVVGAMIYPVTYRLSAECRLQPVLRRTISAPFNAKLHSSHARPGDAVSEGQVLAELDGRETRVELAEAIATEGVAKKRFDHLSVHGSPSALQVAKLEAERINLEVRRLKNQSENLMIRAPIDGVVLSGSLARSEGVPVSKGQKLFEIAPLDRMLVEVAVPEDEIRYVSEGATVHMKLESTSRKVWEAKLERFHPVIKNTDGKNERLAEFTLGNEAGELRPGMKGSVRIATNTKRPIGWILLRHLL